MDPNMRTQSRSLTTCSSIDRSLRGSIRSVARSEASRISCYSPRRSNHRTPILKVGHICDAWWSVHTHNSSNQLRLFLIMMEKFRRQSCMQTMGSPFVSKMWFLHTKHYCYVLTWLLGQVMWCYDGFLNPKI